MRCAFNKTFSQQKHSSFTSNYRFKSILSGSHSSGLNSVLFNFPSKLHIMKVDRRCECIHVKFHSWTSSGSQIFQVLQSTVACINAERNTERERKGEKDRDIQWLNSTLKQPIDVALKETCIILKWARIWKRHFMHIYIHMCQCVYLYEIVCVCINAVGVAYHVRANFISSLWLNVWATMGNIY